MNKHVGMAVVGLLSLFAATAEAANLVPNGNFDGGTYTCTPFIYEGNSECESSVPSGATNVGTPTSVPNDWILDPMDDPTQSDFSAESNAGSGQGGNANYVGFMGTGALTDPGVSEQQGDQDCLLVDVTTTDFRTAQYTLSFYVAITGTIDANASLMVEWDWGQTGWTDYNEPSYFTPTTTTSGWEFVQFTGVTASSGVTQLIFHGSDAGGAILLDNVSVTEGSATPEPASLFLMGSGLLIGGLILGGKMHLKHTRQSHE